MAMSLETEECILGSPGTRYLVHQLLSLTEGKDPVDALKDLDTVVRVLEGRWRRLHDDPSPIQTWLDGSKPI